MKGRRVANDEQKADRKQTCFVLMPISDSPGYEAGHFARVYEHVFKPAIAAAGYKPERADDAVKTDYIVVGIIQKIVDSALVLCDFSARNPNVMYELGVRHAFDKPVVLVKDRRTEKVFDIQGLRHTEYDESLRVDTVTKDILRITAALQETGQCTPGDMNSVVRLAGVRTADVPQGQTISADTQLILDAIGALERRVEAVEDANPAPAAGTFFRVLGGGAVVLANGEAIYPDTVLFKNGDEVGKLISADPAGQKILLHTPNGRHVSLKATAPVAEGLSTIPF